MAQIAEIGGWSLEDDGRVYLDPGDDLPAILAGRIEDGGECLAPVEVWDYLAGEWADAVHCRAGCDAIERGER